MNKLNDDYIGKSADTVINDLKNKGFSVNKRLIEPRKDKDILVDELVIKLEQKENEITVFTSLFMKDIQ